jgi:hypothetical protein
MYNSTTQPDDSDGDGLYLREVNSGGTKAAVVAASADIYIYYIF